MLDKNKAKELASEFRILHEQLRECIDLIKAEFNQEHFNIELYTYEELDTKITKAVNNLEELNTILEFNRVYKLMIENNLQNYADTLIERNIKQDYFEIYLRRFYLLLIDKCQNELFPDFNGEVLDSIRRTFMESDAIIQSMARTKVEQSIIAKIPNYNSIEGLNSEVSILRTEANKSRKIIPFRILFDKIPNLILKLKPCLMMSQIGRAHV